MLDFYKAPTRYNTDAQNLNNLQRPIIQDNVAKWPQTMKESEIRIFEAVARDKLQQYGYEPVLSDPPAMMTIEAAYRQFVEAPFHRSIARLKDRPGQVEAPHGP